MCFSGKKTSVYFSAFVLFLLVAVSVFPTQPAQAFDLTRYALCDIQVVYVFDEVESIDWPTLYYLNDKYGCRVDLVTLGVGAAFGESTREITDRDIYLHTFTTSASDTTETDSVLAVLFSVRRPDILILGGIGDDARYARLEQKLVDLTPIENSIFNIMKVYKYADGGPSIYESVGSVTFNCQELHARYRDRMELEVPLLNPWERPREKEGDRLVRYDLIRRYLPASRQDPDFISGLKTIRLESIVDSVLGPGALKAAFRKRARNFLSFFGFSQNLVGQERVRKTMAGLKELITLDHQIRAESDLTSIPGFLSYMRRLISKSQRAVLNDIGMNWEGTIILRDSPHGPRLKFRASLSVNGPQEIELSYIRFHPYWDSTDVVLDSASRKIQPHQSFVHEYLVEIDRSRLEAQMPESLSFTAEIVYGNFPMTVTSTLPIWESPDLSVHFQPGFHFIQPFARLNIDKVVTSMNWKVVITKPKHYYGTVKLDLDVPRGVFAGAYRQEVELDKGRTQETVRIPFSVSNLFELGLQQQSVKLSVEGREVAADTGIIRIALCHIDEKVRVGFLPDTTGLLEEILRMTDATYRPLTDRTLLTGDLEAYEVILVGPGALRDYSSFRKIRGRLEDYVRYGGSLVILGQPGDWPEGVLPVSLVPARETLIRSEVLNRITGARILSQPHSIKDDELLADFDKRRQVSVAVVSPAERVYVTPTGATLLSVSKLGDGQIIFCGLPLVELISRLNLEAIHLLANILNY